MEVVRSTEIPLFGTLYSVYQRRWQVTTRFSQAREFDLFQLL